MKKSDRIEAEVGGPWHGELTAHPCYTGWFTLFNQGRYYEAHDVLEHLWLRTTGPNHAFFKGLIQLAGAFVHLQKQHARPSHPKDGRRLHPAARLFRLAGRNLATHGPRHLRLDVESVTALCRDWTSQIESTDFRRNPWHPENLPAIHLG